MGFVRDIEWEACLLEPRSDSELERRIRRETGQVAGMTRYFASCPWVAEVLAALSGCLLTRVHVDHDLADLAGLVVSQDNSCRYCYAMQRVLLRMVGVPEARIAELEQDLLTAELDPRDRAALDFVRRVSRSAPLPSPAEKKWLRDAGFSEIEVKELAGIAALNVLFNRVSTLPALPPARWEEFPDRWLVRLLRPLLARRIRSMRQRSRPVFLREDQKTGPFSEIVLALDGLPLAGALRRALDELWRSPVLPVRAKALVFAVVARALGCSRCERESLRLLSEQGLSEPDAQEILSHLGSSRLDDVEAVVVPFARETVWYQAASIQRRARAVREVLSTEQFLELIGVASIANCVGRLGIVVGEAG